MGQQTLESVLRPHDSYPKREYDNYSQVFWQQKSNVKITLVKPLKILSTNLPYLKAAFPGLDEIQKFEQLLLSKQQWLDYILAYRCINLGRNKAIPSSIAKQCILGHLQIQDDYLEDQHREKKTNVKMPHQSSFLHHDTKCTKSRVKTKLYFLPNLACELGAPFSLCQSLMDEFYPEDKKDKDRKSCMGVPSVNLLPMTLLASLRLLTYL